MTKNPDVKIIYHDGNEKNEVWENFVFPYPRKELADLIKIVKATKQELEPYLNLLLRTAIDDPLFSQFDFIGNFKEVDKNEYHKYYKDILIRLPSSVVEGLGIDPYMKASVMIGYAVMFPEYRKLNWKKYCRRIEMPKDLIAEIKGRYGKYDNVKPPFDCGEVWFG